MSQAQNNSQSFPEVATFDGNVELYATQYAQVGQILDMWGDLVEGYGEKAEEFYSAFAASFEAREIIEVVVEENQLNATGFFAPYRRMEFIGRGVVTVPVYIATQGKDLYVSWRAFIQGHISGLRVALWLILCLLIAFFLSSGGDLEVAGENVTEDNFQTFLVVFVVLIALTGIAGALRGFFYHQGDALAVWREPLNELLVDDVIALSNAVHYSILAAADQIGIDTTRLQVREPFYTPRNRQRRI